MLHSPSTRLHQGRVHIVLATMLLTCAFAARAVSEGVVDPEGIAGFWQTGKPVPIEADGVRARFTVPTQKPGSRTLVIVSTLGTEANAFPVTLSVHAAGPEKLVAPKIAKERRREAPHLIRSVLKPPPRPASHAPPRERTFHMMVRDGDVISASNYTEITGKLRAVGHRVQVYIDEDDDEADLVKPEVLKDLVTTFDDQIFPHAAKNLGVAKDVDQDGRFTILMSSWLTRLASGRHAVDGFVRGADLDIRLGAPFSNQCDMMYLSTALTSGPHLRTVLAHEYTHAVTFSAKSLATLPTRGTTTEEEGWLDEAFSHLVEDLHAFSRTNINYRVSAFLSQPEHYRLLVDDYYASDLFRSHGNRGGTYLFMRWCVDRFGPALLPTLVRSEHFGVKNLEAATGRSFADLYREWSIALFMSGFDTRKGSTPAFQSLDLSGPFDDWDLAGPRTTAITPGSSVTTWNSASTSSRYFIVAAAPTGVVDVSIEAQEDANLQVTAIPLPDDLAELKLDVSRASDDPRLFVGLREVRGIPLKLLAIAWEPLVPGPNPHAATFRHARLDQLGIASAFGSSAIPARGGFDAIPIDAAGAFVPQARGSKDAETSPIVVKAVGIDGKGRRVTAWAELSSVAHLR